MHSLQFSPSFEPTSRFKKVRVLVAPSWLILRPVQCGLSSKAFWYAKVQRYKLLAESSERTAFLSFILDALIQCSHHTPERSGMWMFGSVPNWPLFASLEGSGFRPLSHAMSQKRTYVGFFSTQQIVISYQRISHQPLHFVSKYSFPDSNNINRINSTRWRSFRIFSYFLGLFVSFLSRFTVVALTMLMTLKSFLKHYAISWTLVHRCCEWEVRHITRDGSCVNYLDISK